MLLNLIVPTIYKPMRIHGNNSTRYGNNQLPPIDKVTVSPDTYCVRLLGKILFVIVSSISGSCQSMVYRSKMLAINRSQHCLACVAIIRNI